MSTDVLNNGEEFVVNGRYKLIRKLGSGSFGVIYLAHNINNGEEVAVKLESIKLHPKQLKYEGTVLYQYLRGIHGIPQTRFFCVEGEYSCLIMDLLGQSLEDLFNACSRRFSLKTVLMLADQMLHRIEDVHSRGFLHRDVKPDNMLMGIGRNSNTLYFIDFGLAKKYFDSHGVHIPFKKGVKLTGTPRYASVNSITGGEISRRDDLESLGYVIVYFLLGELPWQGIYAANKKMKHEKIAEKKLNTSFEELCKDLPVEFPQFLSYSRQLRFDEKPDYSYLRCQFRDLFHRSGFKFDHVYDWNSL